ncbi:MAG: hypothetical protein F6K58_32180 [Symploca sp. SIO2E9]|nr:hypothetical protein [Symploca sp. SIO2E9]
MESYLCQLSKVRVKLMVSRSISNIIALAARAYAALKGAKQVTNEHVAAIAQLALQHRRPEALQSNQMPWSEEDSQRVNKILNGE